MGMDKSFRDILFGQEREDDMSTRSEEDMTAAVRGEFSNAESLIAQARERGFSLSAFFSGAELPKDMSLPVRKSQTFYVKKHTSAQRPYMHSHEFYELIYVQTGHCLQTLRNGERIRLQKGQCCLLRPGEAHSEGAVPHMNNANSRHTESALFFARDCFGIKFSHRQSTNLSAVSPAAPTV